jgi:DNA-binding response OmpR family regulator
MPTALIVEDEPEANKLLSLLVQLRGYKTESAYTGTEALAKVETRRPDVVFLDLMLPDTNGFDICRSLKARRETNLIPVVMVTARLADENRAQSYRVGANDYIPKPYTPDQIFESLRAADLWRREVENQGTRGRILLDAGCDVGPFAGVTRLWSVMLARTAWNEDQIRQLGLTLLELGQEAIEWGRRHDAGLVATVDYEILSDQIRVLLHDQSGWFAESEHIARAATSEFLLSHFDEISRVDSSPEIALVKRFHNGAAPRAE